LKAAIDPAPREEEDRLPEGINCSNSATFFILIGPSNDGIRLIQLNVLRVFLFASDDKRFFRVFLIRFLVFTVEEKTECCGWDTRGPSVLARGCLSRSRYEGQSVPELTLNDELRMPRE